MIKSLYLLPIFSKVTFAMCPMNFWSASKFSALAIILYGTSQYPHLLMKGLQCLSRPHLFGVLHFYAKMWMGCLLKCCLNAYICFHILILSCLKLSIRQCFGVPKKIWDPICWKPTHSHLGTDVQNHLSKITKIDGSILINDVLNNSGEEGVRLVNNFILVCWYNSENKYLNAWKMI